jgi:hypothetical protein
MRLMHEITAGTADMVDQCEEAYLASCEHNGTGPDDQVYFRRYVWNMIALITLRLRALRLEHDDT